MSKTYHSTQYNYRQREMKEKITFVEIYISVKRTTEKAILIDCDGKEAWIPKSLIKDFDDQEVNVRFTGNIEIPEWIANEKELI